MKKIKTIIISILMLTFIAGLCACNVRDEIGTIDKSVTFPEQYSITYSIENKDGVCTPLKKTVDGEGNIYFCSGEEEKLFIKNGASYTLYEKDHNGDFVVVNSGETYNKKYVDNATAKFNEYAEQSKKQFIPTAKNTGEQTVFGRTCSIYEIKLGGTNNGVKYSYYVDSETGICLGFETGASVSGFDITTDDEIFTCTEFITENVASLKGLI